MKLPFINILLLFTLFGFSQETEVLTWPRVIEKGNHTINLYQPQLETLEGNKLKGRMALSVKDSEENIIFGALWFSVRLATDLESMTAVLESMNISKIKFPDFEDQSKLDKLQTIIIDNMESVEMVMSLDRIISSLETASKETRLEDQLNNTAPEIYFRKVPTVLVVIDGEPQLRKVENSKMEYVINTPFFIVSYKNTFYLKGANHWYQANKVVTNTWEKTKRVPKDVRTLSEQKFDKVDPDSEIPEETAVPEIIVVTKASELVISDGELTYEPIEGTSLLYVTNTESDIVLDINTQHHYLLLNGRWYSTRTLKDMEWQFIEPESLPDDFASIPADNESISGMRSSVPGTPESQEAIYEQYIPQTAVVDRKKAGTEVTYDGEPKFEVIEGTSMAYAINTQSTVLAVDDSYYVVDNGIWFKGSKPTGPWAVADSRPEEIENIPPSSPVYNVKYVYVYDTTPEVVYVGYTPGYYHSYVYGGVVVYGTGYYYRPWYGYYYYPRPVTYGYAVHYNPYTGWGFAVGVSYGWMTFAYRYAYWGPRGYAHGYRHGYHYGYHRGYHNGYAAGYHRGRYDSGNAYRHTREGGTRTGVTTGREARTEQRSNQGQLSGPRSTEGKRNDLYADRSGNVHQRDRDGNWEQKRNNKSQQRQPQTRESQPRQNSQNQKRQRQQLERDYNSRNRGNTNYRSYNQNRSRPQGRVGGRGRRG
ncbi:MAG: hypothetical protein ACR2MM_11530 [Flavobacteriaceae bacterium]